LILAHAFLPTFHFGCFSPSYDPIRFSQWQRWCILHVRGRVGGTGSNDVVFLVE
jgi:hypothetical protein